MKARSLTTLLTLLLLFAGAAFNAYAENTLTVTKTADTEDGVCDDDCSLREAVAAAAPGDTIAFSPLFLLPQTITLAAGEILIDKSLIINGPGASLLSISGNDADRIFKITNGPAVVMNGMRLRNGRPPSSTDGGALHVTASGLELSNMTFNDNWARGQIAPNNFVGRGGAIYGDQSTIVIRDLEFYNNASVNGAAAYTDRGSITMVRVTVRNNTGSGVAAGSRERMEIDDSRIVGNSGTGVVSTGKARIHNTIIADNRYGGIAGLAGSILDTSLDIDHCIVSNNTKLTNLADSGAGIISQRFATIRSTVVSGNRAVRAAGGIKSGGTMYIYNSAIVNNDVTVHLDLGGGGIETSGNLFLINSTVSGNYARGTGGGIYAWANANVNIVNSTIASNSVFEGAGGGLRRDGNSIVHSQNSIFANNTSQGAGPDVWGPVVSEGFNLVRNPAGSSGWTSSDLIKQDPLLGPLGSNGGNTYTHALLPGSPALNAGNNALAIDPQTMKSLTTDQRGSPRFVGGEPAVVDIGAYEANYSSSPVDVIVRATNAAGRGLDRTRLMIDDGAGNIVYTQTNPFGYYRLSNLIPGTTYTITPIHKLYLFDSPTLFTADQNRDLNLIGTF